jgi:Zn finger protein HypA/HybF involved in hydrogenase expression
MIKRANKVHSNKYDYSEIDYKKMKIPIKIICKKHGIFMQRMDNHLSGQGCPKCGKLSMIKKQSCSKEEFVNKANIIHNNKYDYFLTEYINAKSKVKIICPVHGEFEQKANNHLSGYGCTECQIDNMKKTQEEYIKEVIKKHGDEYDYSSTFYKGSKIKIEIKCKIHGIFKQMPGNHLRGQRCPKCENIRNRIRTIDRIKKRKIDGQQFYPNYNDKACDILDDISKENNITIQHARNGGEFYIKELGYWLDGYDKENNVVYEIDEKHHFNKGELKEKDKIRQKEIEYLLDSKFIRIKIG